MYGLTPPDTTPANSSAWSSHRWDTADSLGSIATKYRISAGACLAECLVEELESKRGWNFSIPPTKKDWSYFASRPVPDHWSALINYLLQVTFFKPLKQLKGPTGRLPDRGLDEPLYLTSRTPTGNIAFAVVDYNAEGTGGEPFDWIAFPGTLYPAEGEWRPIDAIPWSALTGDSAPGGGGGREMEPTPSAESGQVRKLNPKRGDY